MDIEPQYEVVSPLGAPPAAGRTRAVSAPPLDRIDGKRIGLVWTVFANGDLVLRAFRDHLAARHPTAEFVEMAPGRNVRWGDHPEPSIGELARALRLDAAIVTAGC